MSFTTPTIVLPPAPEPEQPNMRCCKCGGFFGPKLGHACGVAPSLQSLQERAALDLLDAAEFIFLRHELHGDTRYLEAAIAAFKRGRGLNEELRTEDELSTRVWQLGR